MDDNSWIHVTLTAAGAAELNRIHTCFNRSRNYKGRNRYKTNYKEGDHCSTQFWNFMDLFGKYYSENAPAADILFKKIKLRSTSTC